MRSPFCGGRSTLWALLAAAFCILPPRAALADPFLVTSGAMVLPGVGAKFHDGSMSLQGPGLDVGVVGPTWFPGNNLPNAFFAGETVDLSTTVQPGGSGFARVGMDHFVDVNFGGALQFTATPFVTQDTGATSFPSIPFTMTGQLFGRFRDDPSRLAFSIQLVGAGTMSVFDLLRFPPQSPSDPASYATFRATRVMSFEEPPAPVPEPGTVLLIAIGAATMCSRAKRRKSTFAR